MEKSQTRNFLLALSLAALIMGGCGIDNTDENVVGSNLIMDEGTFVPEMDIPVAALPQGSLLGIKSYKINYTTTNSSGERVKASGMITIPTLTQEFLTGYKNNVIPGVNNPTNSDFSLSIVSDQHATIFTNAEAPSNATTPSAVAVGFAAQALFMLVQPDYVGYGDSNETHPFIIEETLAANTVDMIKAAIAFANSAGLPINGQVYLSGYSEGGYVTMAAAKEIQENHADVTLKAVAPMSGPYDVEAMALTTLEQPMMAFPPFLAFLSHAYASTYDDININNFVNAPYSGMLSTLFDGAHSATEIYLSLPNLVTGTSQAPDDLFVSSYVDDILANPDNALRKRFVENSVIDWNPTMPVNLYHCVNDAVIPYTMTTLAHASFTEQGSTTVNMVPIDTVEANVSDPTQVHADCGSVAYGQVIPWFAQIRSGE